MEGQEDYQDNKSFISDMNLAREIVQYMRKQRHYFMNNFQVIWGYLQLNRPEDAQKYIARTVKNQEVYSKILNFENAVLSIFLYNQVMEAEKHGISIEFNTELDYIRDDIFTHLGHEKLDIMNRLFNTVMNMVSSSGFDKIIYINIYKQDGKLYIKYSINWGGGSDAAGKYGLMNMIPQMDRTIDMNPEIGTCIEHIDSEVTARVWLKYVDTL